MDSYIQGHADAWHWWPLDARSELYYDDGHLGLRLSASNMHPAQLLLISHGFVVQTQLWVLIGEGAACTSEVVRLTACPMSYASLQNRSSNQRLVWLQIR